MPREKAIESVCDFAPANLPDADSMAIREQMHRMLDHSLFRHGRRCPALFQYAVERTLERNTALLKERIIGVEVFARTPDYDTNADSVVRTAAAELRKRIAQYYQEPGHESEVRIELRSGSYVPEFRFVETRAAAPRMEGEPVPVILPKRAARFARALPTAAVAVAILSLALSVLRPWRADGSLNKFWGPVIGSPGTVLLFVGQRLRPPPEPDGGGRSPIPSDLVPQPDVSLSQFYSMGAQNVALPDAIAISKLSGFLRARGKTSRVIPESNATFDDLRGCPAILIGGFTNDWTARLMSHWRFSSASAGGISWIEDREHPGRRDWAVNYRSPYTSIIEDYAIVSRATDPTTGMPVVVVAGVAGYGTMAAVEFVTDPAEIREIEKMAPANWGGKSLQLVLKTNVFGRSAGPPRVMAAQFW
jgi:hypothetical protein